MDTGRRTLGESLVGSDVWRWPDLEELEQDVGNLRYAFRIGDWWLLVPAGMPAELSPILPCTRLPFTRHWCLGLANFRGDLLPVYDLGAVIEEPGRRAGGYFLVLGQRDLRAALCIDEIKTVAIADGSGFNPVFPPPNLTPDLEVTGIDLEGVVYAQIDLMKVLEILSERAGRPVADPSK